MILFFDAVVLRFSQTSTNRHCLGYLKGPCEENDPFIPGLTDRFKITLLYHVINQQRKLTGYILEEQRKY